MTTDVDLASRPARPPRRRAALSLAADFQAGVARVKITPPSPFWMSGYAARTHPSEGVEQDLWAKALALRDGGGPPVVIVTTDLIGLPRAISDEVAERVRERLPRRAREQLVLSASHTHCGPAVRKNLAVLYDFAEEDRRRVDAYGAELVDRLVEVAGAALGDLAPARLSVGHGSVGFAVNRREPTPEGVKIGVEPRRARRPRRAGARRSPRRTARSGPCCSATPATTRRSAADFYRIGGDYAGYAQATLEKAHPGATALFVMLCGGDQNPNPRGHARPRRGSTATPWPPRSPACWAAALRPVRPADPHRARGRPARLRPAHARGVRGGGEEPRPSSASAARG